MRIQLSDNFTYKRLLKFTFPSIIMMIFTSIYGVVDGFFVSNFVGKTEFAAVNFIMPLIMMLGAIGFMFGAGGGALIAKTLGEGDKEKANKLFSLFVYVTLVLGSIVTVIGIIFIRPIASFLGASGAMLDNCVIYGIINLVSMPIFMLQFEFQSFFVTAEKPQLGLYVTIACGITNMALDAIFMAILDMGIVGAALATAISQALGGLLPIIYFSRKNTSLLRLCKTDFDISSLLKACTNGSSELMSNISMSLVGMLYNAQLMKFAGENGVAAYGVLMYVNFVFISAFIGFSTGVAPVISYHYGAGNHKELKSLLRKSCTVILSFSAAMFIFAELLAKPLAGVFVAYDKELFDLTLKGFLIYSFSFLFSGMAIFGSAFFTALNNGLVSAFISFLRTLVLQTVAVLLLPMFMGIDGIWASVVFAELCASVVTALLIFSKRKKYKY